MAIAECTSLIIDKVYCMALLVFGNCAVRIPIILKSGRTSPAQRIGRAQLPVEFRAVWYSPWTRYISPPEPQVVTKSLMRSIACLHVVVVTFRGNRRRSLRGAVSPPSLRR